MFPQVWSSTSETVTERKQSRQHNRVPASAACRPDPARFLIGIQSRVVGIAGFYQHVPGRALRVATLTRVARALTPDGVLILMMVCRRLRGLVSRRLVDLLRALGAKVGFAGAREVRAESEAAGFDAREETPGWWVCRPAFP